MASFEAMNMSLADIRATLNSDGYVHIKQLFPQYDVQTIRLKSLEMLKKNGYTTSDDIANLKQPTRKIGSPEFITCIADMMSIQEIHHLSRHPNVMSLMKEILGGNEVLAHPRKMYRITYPYNISNQDRIPAHQDFFYVRGEIDTFTCWVPLGNYGKNHGVLEVLPRSHRDGLAPSAADKNGQFRCTACHVSEKAEFKCIEFELGDALIFHSLTVHGSGINRSDRFRLSIDFRFSKKNGLLNQEQLWPPYYPKIKNWKSVSSGWDSLDVVTLSPSDFSLHDAKISADQIYNMSSSQYLQG